MELTVRGVFRGIALGLTLTAAAGAVPPGRDPSESTTFVDTVYYDEADEVGRLRGGVTEVTVTLPAKGAAPTPAPFETLWPAGPQANRIDLVFVGDGYTQSQLGAYAGHVTTLSNAYFAKEPFITYRPFYNVHRVDVVSNESGVDNDPSPGISRDTALDMGFWCGGIERLLCVSVDKAYSHARNAPDVDLVAALANSSKYGGAGYISSDLATASAANGSSSEVLLHEFGHALGDLADEYDYADGARYTGGEFGEPNVSILTASEMEQAGTKWADWLGVNIPAFDGLVSAYEGANYYQYGAYRPTPNSIMRTLNRPFNLPSIEAIILEMYGVVRPVDASSPTDQAYNGRETLFVDPVDPVGHSLEIQWSLDGVPIAGATGETLDLCALDISPGSHEVSVRVVDGTEWVRDESARAQWLTQTLSFDVVISGQSSERIKKATCADRQGVNRVIVKLVGGSPGGTFEVRLSDGQSAAGTLNGRGKAKVTFEGVPSGPGMATATWECNVTDTRSYTCP